MRRSLADSTFLRVYVLMAVALLLTFCLTLVGLAMIDRVQREHHREHLAEAPMRLLVQWLSSLPEEERMGWLEGRAESLDLSPTLYPARAMALNYFERTRLENGRVLVRSLDDHGWRLQHLLPGGDWLLQVDLAGPSERQLRGFAGLLGEWLSRVEGEARRTRLQRVAGGSLPAKLSAAPPEGVGARQLARLADGEVLVRLLPERGSLSLHLRLTGSDDGLDWLAIGPIHTIETIPGALQLLLLMIMLGVLAVTIYLIVRGVESRVTRLELAATRIAAGRLDTRVKVESGDFLGRLGMAFNGMAAQVQSLLRAQQDMIRAVSHELRTPVARIRFAAQMVEDMTDDAAIRYQLQGIDGDIEELDGLIDEILTYARLGSDSANGKEIETTPVDGRAMARRVIEALRPLHHQLEIDLVEGREVEVSADGRYLQRALQNLVANACRHARSRVLIRLHSESRLVRIDVEDDGPGIPVAERLEVFKPFARLDDSRTRRSGGYGLGLSIVQKIMNWHGGSVSVDDSPTLGGARFTLLLPRRSNRLAG